MASRQLATVSDAVALHVSTQVWDEKAVKSIPCGNFSTGPHPLPAHLVTLGQGISQDEVAMASPSPDPGLLVSVSLYLQQHNH